MNLNKEELDKDLHTIASEIEGLMLSGKVRAIAAIVVTDDGMLHTRVRHISNGRIPLLAGVTLMQHDIALLIRSNVDGKNGK